MTGRIRVLPPDTPGVPPSKNYDLTVGYGRQACQGSVTFPPDIERQVFGTIGSGDSGVYCTRDPHGDDEPHICHLRDHADNRPLSKVTHIIVWDSE